MPNEKKISFSIESILNDTPKKTSSEKEGNESQSLKRKTAEQNYPAPKKNKFSTYSQTAEKMDLLLEEDSLTRAETIPTNLSPNRNEVPTPALPTRSFAIDILLNPMKETSETKGSLAPTPEQSAELKISSGGPMKILPPITKILPATASFISLKPAPVSTKSREELLEEIKKRNEEREVRRTVNIERNRALKALRRSKREAELALASDAHIPSSKPAVDTPEVEKPVPSAKDPSANRPYSVEPTFSFFVKPLSNPEPSNPKPSNPELPKQRHETQLDAILRMLRESDATESSMPPRPALELVLEALNTGAPNLSALSLNLKTFIQENLPQSEEQEEPDLHEKITEELKKYVHLKVGEEMIPTDWEKMHSKLFKILQNKQGNQKELEHCVVFLEALKKMKEEEKTNMTPQKRINLRS